MPTSRQRGEKIQSKAIGKQSRSEPVYSMSGPKQCPDILKKKKQKPNQLLDNSPSKEKKYWKISLTLLCDTTQSQLDQ